MKISVDSIIDLFTLLVLKYLINTFLLALNITQNGIEKNTSTSER